MSWWHGLCPINLRDLEGDCAFQVWAVASGLVGSLVEEVGGSGCARRPEVSQQKAGHTALAP